MRKSLFLGAAALTLGLAACNPPAAGTAGAGAGAAANGKTFKVGVSIPAATHGWAAGVNWWAEQVKNDYPGVEFVIETCDTSDDQIADLQNLQTARVDAVVILAFESGPLTPAAKQLKKAGIMVVNVDRGFTEPVADVFIAGDNEAFGRKSAEFMVSKLNGAGKIAILRGMDTTVDDARFNSAMEVFKAAPGIQVVAAERGEWNREEAEKVTANILTQNAQLDAIWASDDDMALGAEAALKAAGREDSLWMMPGAGMKDVVKRVMDKDPLFPANITYSPSMIAVGMHQAASILLAGREKTMRFMPRNIKLDVELITPENAADFYFPDAAY
jgi:ribose transport system substrate-binding protein